jgi:hypothetical protein
VFVVSFAITFFLLTYNRTLNPSDEGLLLYNFQKVAEGQVPHRDFYDVYGPAIYWIGGTLFKSFGVNIIVVRVFLVILKTAMALLIFLIARRLLPVLFSTLAGVLFVLNWGDPYSPVFNILYAGHVYYFLVLLGIYLMILYIERDGIVWLCGVSLCLGLAVLFKLPAAIITFIGFAIFLSLREQSGGSGTVGVVAANDSSASQSTNALRIVKCLGAAGIIVFYLALFMKYHLDIYYFFLYLLPLFLMVMPILFVDLVRFWSDTYANHRHTLRRSYRDVFILIGGMSIFCLWELAYYASVGGLAEFVYDMIVLPSSLNYYRPMNDYRLHAIISAVVVILVMVATAVGRMLQNRGNVARAGFWTISVGIILFVPGLLLLQGVSYLTWHVRTIHILPTTTLLVAAYLFFPQWQRVRREGVAARETLVLGLIYILACQGFLTSFPRTDEAHIQLNTTVLFILVSFLLWKLVCGWERLLSKHGKMKGLVFAVLCFGVVAFPYVWSIKALYVFPSAIPLSVIREFPAHIAYCIERNARNSYPRLKSDLPRAEGLKLSLWASRPHTLFVVEDIFKIIYFVRENTTRDDEIFVMCEPQIVYFLSGRHCFLSKRNYFVYLVASGFLDHVAGEILTDEQLMQKLSESRPPFIIRVRGRYGDSTQRIKDAWPKAASWIENNYEVVAIFGIYDIVRLQSRRPAASIIEEG